MKKIWICGLWLGVSLTQLGLFLFRCFWDGASPWVLFEFWLSLGLFVLSVVMTWTTLGASHTRFWKNLKECLALGLSATIGLALVAGSTLQHIQYRARVNLALVQDQTLSKNELVLLAASDCQSTKKFFLNLQNNNTLSLSVFDKHFLKQQALLWHNKKCLADKDVFVIVKDLRFRPTAPLIKSSALHDYNFTTPSSYALEQDLAITTQGWCLHLNNPKTLCESLPNVILLSPVDYEQIVKSWKQAQNSLK